MNRIVYNKYLYTINNIVLLYTKYITILFHMIKNIFYYIVIVLYTCIYNDLLHCIYIPFY